MSELISQKSKYSNKKILIEIDLKEFRNTFLQNSQRERFFGFSSRKFREKNFVCAKKPRIQVAHETIIQTT